MIQNTKKINLKTPGFSISNSLGYSVSGIVLIDMAPV